MAELPTNHETCLLLANEVLSRSWQCTQQDHLRKEAGELFGNKLILIHNRHLAQVPKTVADGNYSLL